MDPNKINYIKSLQEYNVFRNDRPQRLLVRNERNRDIITHLENSNHYHNPEASHMPFSSRKTIPLNSQVIRQRSEMIVHPSKLSRQVPNWFKGDTYKYYNRAEYQQLASRNLSTLEYNPITDLVSKHISNRSQIATPRSQRSSISSGSDVFYVGGGRRLAPARRSQSKKVQKEIAPKIGSLQSRAFDLPRVPLKIGHSEYINTHKAW